MGSPLVSILWLNYNSMKIIDIVLESLKAVEELDYPNYELIIVDNGSDDGSFEKIRDFVESRPGLRRVTRIIQNDTNLGFAGGMNVAFRARSRESKYVALLNNDAIPEPDSVSKLVEELEARPELGAAQGVILRLSDGRIDTAGGYLSRFIYGANLLRGAEPPGLRKPLYITYADGAYAIIRVEAALRAMKGERLFYDELFGYCDDNVLGVRLWESGYRVATFPYIVARHARGATFGKASPSRIYYSSRCLSYFYHSSRLTLGEKLVVRMVFTRRMLTVPLVARDARLYAAFRRGWRDGAKLAEKLPPVNHKKAALIPASYLDALKLLVAVRYFQPDVRKLEEIHAVED